MNDGDRLWRAILHRPHSRRLRQVYADWLEEHGDPRAEFLRLQGRAVPADPHREAEVLRRHELEWLGPMAGHLRDWEFAGGLIDWVCVETPVFLAHAEEWVRRPGLLGVHLRRMQGHVADVANCPAIARLPYLFLGDNDLTADDLRTLLGSKYLRGVRALYLQSNRLGNDGFEALAGAPVLSRLRELSVANNNMREMPGVPAGSPLGQVRILNVSHNFASAAACGRLLASPGLPRLRRLHLSGNTGEPGNLAGLADSPAFARLRSFSFSLGDGSDGDLGRFAGSPHLGGLRRLWLDFMDSSAGRGVEALASSDHFTRLGELTLTSGIRHQESLAVLGQSSAFPRLRSLSVSRNIWVDDRPATQSIVAFLGGPVVHRLRTLGVEGWQLDDDCVRALGGRGPLPLEGLRLSTVPASPATWADAGTALGRLTNLTLVENPSGVLAALLGAGGGSGLRAVALEKAGPADADALAGLTDLTRLRLTAEERDATEVFDRLMGSPHAGRWRSLNLGYSFGARSAGFEGSRLTALEELSQEAMTAEAITALAGWPGLADLRRLRIGRPRAGSLAPLATSPHLGQRLRLVVDDNGGPMIGGRPANDTSALRARLGGRAAFQWRTNPRGIVIGGWPHDDT